MARATRLVLGVIAIALVGVSPAGGALGAPSVTGPPDGAVVGALPVFAWNAVAGADRYEFEISADAGFNSPVLGLSFDHFFTKNTRATLTKTVPNGTYWWRVRAVSAEGSVSAWSPGSSFTKNWASAPPLSAPANGSTITFPADPFRLAWQPVAGAAKYEVTLATDPTLGTPRSGYPVITQATTFTLAKPLAPEEVYYWGITPIDAQGNRGSASAVWSFTWHWPSTTTPVVTDVASDPEIYDFEFTWGPVAGAAGYELEVSRSVDFAEGSRVCCPVNAITGLTTLGTSYSPTLVLPNNNSYYWRVRAIDASGNHGEWNVGPQFSKAFDNQLPSIQNLRMVDNPFRLQTFETSTPVVSWDAVPGASAYEVEVTRFTSGCQWSASTEHWKNTTATTFWTPLGSGWNGVKPYSSNTSSLNVSTDLPALIAGHSYCVRVTALDRPSNLIDPYIRSTPTYLPNSYLPPTEPTVAAFTWSGPAAGGPCSAPCNPGSLGRADYVAPITGTTQRTTPLFRWNPLAGYESYFVIVSSDPDFTNLVDYAFTQVAAYAPRTGFGPRTYADETNVYYWAVLPSTERNGSSVITDPLSSAPSNFLKQSIPPAPDAPADGTVFAGAVRFHWTPAVGARRYRLEVSQDSRFSTVSEAIVTDSISYTSSVTYSADVTLYWRVRAEDENLIGLNWSPMRTFRKTLPAPVLDPGNPTGGDALPTWEWGPVTGAVSYEMELQQPDGIKRAFDNLPSAAATPTEMKGTGIWHWKVRANFPRVDQLQVVKGPWSPTAAFARTIREPGDPRDTVGANRLLLEWNPKMGAQNYRVQVSTRPDFATLAESITTDNTSWASLLTQPVYFAGGTFYWRVAAADSVVANVGDFTTNRSFTLPGSGAATKMSSSTTVSVRKTATRIKVTGAVFPGHAGKRVSVTLYRKRSGVFRAVATKFPVLSTASSYATRFARPRYGACKVTARFAGDADHYASSKAVKFRC
jgi:hypothetical protein